MTKETPFLASDWPLFIGFYWDGYDIKGLKDAIRKVSANMTYRLGEAAEHDGLVRYRFEYIPTVFGHYSACMDEDYVQVEAGQWILFYTAPDSQLETCFPLGVKGYGRDPSWAEAQWRLKGYLKSVHKVLNDMITDAWKKKTDKTD